jgi:hypothetical protein
MLKFYPVCMSYAPTVDAVVAKLDRANKHILVAKRLAERFMKRECKTADQVNSVTNLIELRAVLPAPPMLISLVLGDAVHNLRSALDHTVFAAVMSNPERPPDTPNVRTMFPVSDSPQGFADQLKRGRLRGLPGRAIRVVDSLQPYHRRNLDPDNTRHPLFILDHLENIDKHRRLTLCACVGTSGQTRLKFDNGPQDVRIAHKRVYDGDVLARFPRPTPEQGGLNVDGKLSFSVLFRESVFPTEVDPISVLHQIDVYIRRTVLRRLGPFIGTDA